MTLFSARLRGITATLGSLLIQLQACMRLVVVLNRPTRQHSMCCTYKYSAVIELEYCLITACNTQDITQNSTHILCSSDGSKVAQTSHGQVKYHGPSSFQSLSISEGLLNEAQKLPSLEKEDTLAKVTRGPPFRQDTSVLTRIMHGHCTECSYAAMFKILLTYNKVTHSKFD